MPIFFTKKSCNRGVEPPPQMPLTVNPFARRYSGLALSQAYESNETEKKRSHNDRVLQIENATFTPLVFSCTRGMAPECSHVLQTTCFDDLSKESFLDLR